MADLFYRYEEKTILRSRWHVLSPVCQVGVTVWSRYTLMMSQNLIVSTHYFGITVMIKNNYSFDFVQYQRH